MHYTFLGKSGLRVSELCLGTMTFGTEWGSGTDYQGSKAIFDAFVQAGGNFIDTANRYTEGSSERFVGEFVHSDRDAFVLATKYSLYDRRDDLNAHGNHRKNLLRSIEASLRRLQTEYIDLLWLHAWDFTTPQDEVLRGLDDLVRSGKVHYIGISDTPAWIIAQMNQSAELRGWTQFVGLQVEYSLIARTPERELLPMAKHWGMSLTPWGALGGGLLSGKYLQAALPDEKRRLAAGSQRLQERNLDIARKVVEVAQKLGVAPGQVALNWTRQRGQSVIPIVGARRAEQLQESLGCLSFGIPDELLAELDAASAIELGFPHDFLQSAGVRDVLFGGNYDKLRPRR